jgi:hypothetical protein
MAYERKHIARMTKLGAEIEARSKKHPPSPEQFLAQVKRLRAGSARK